MSIKTIPVSELGLPAFDPGDKQDGVIFDLSSHKRAREALALALSMKDAGFNVFVLGENQSGRLTATVEHLETASKTMPAPSDWIYLNNFNELSEPVSARLPAGQGRAFRDAMERLVLALGEALKTAFGGDAFQHRMQSEGEAAQKALAASMKEIQDEARQHGLEIVQSPQGPMIIAVDEGGEAIDPDKMTDEQRETMAQHGPALAHKIQDISRQTAEIRTGLQEKAGELGRQVADQTCGPMVDSLIGEFSAHDGLSRWLVKLRNDVIDNYRVFLPANDENPRPAALTPESRYAVNLLVDNKNAEYAPVIVEPNPTYQNLFGRIEYRQSMRSMETDFTLIQPGSLHRANGGVLVLRADAIASDPGVWNALKGALRDCEIRVEEPYRQLAPPVAGALSPEAVDLSIKIVLVGAPNWYYTFFSADPEFRSYFKIKADIDPRVDADTSNLETYGGLIRQMAREDGAECEDDAVSRLLGIASRWAADRTKLSSQFERIADVLAEARQVAAADGQPKLTAATIDIAIENRRRRNARFEDRIQEGIADESVLIATTGSAVGQINALTVRDIGDHSFGTPSRVTASASVGRRGVLNIERDVGLGGPIQQKGALVLQGWLTGMFAREFPLSFNVSMTFEQSYGGVDGDSASLAELIAILSDLADIPVRQDLAITGSVNQHGLAQAIGGAHHKIEGFFRTCLEAGTLDGGQGVVVPAANEKNLVLRRNVADAVEEGKFAIYSVETIEDAVELFTGVPAGEEDAKGEFPQHTVFGKVAAKLQRYDQILMQRDGAF